MDWISDPVVSRGVSEQGFTLKCQGRLVPGVAWWPEEGAAPRPVVLLGHGGNMHKRSDYILSIARRFVRHKGFAAVAIDGPIHGDRSSGPEGDLQSRGVAGQAWWSDGSIDRMIEDWRTTLDALQSSDLVGQAPVGYWGLSMGTFFGLSFVAAEPRVRAAVLGLMGAMGSTKERQVQDAQRVACPALFLHQWDDELIPRDRALKLFDAIGSRDKRLHSHPGRHIEVPREATDASEEFLAAHLST